VYCVNGPHRVESRETGTKSGTCQGSRRHRHAGLILHRLCVSDTTAFAFPRRRSADAHVILRARPLEPDTRRSSGKRGRAVLLQDLPSGEKGLARYPWYVHQEVEPACCGSRPARPRGEVIENRVGVCLGPHTNATGTTERAVVRVYTLRASQYIYT